MENEKSIYHPWKPPFRYDNDLCGILDSEGNRILDIRGHGFLTGQGIGGLGLDSEEAMKIQDRIGEYIVGLMNAETNKKTLKEELDALTEFQRYDLFHEYCVHCGGKDPRCWCSCDD
jgi:hypothetical protein